MRTSSLLVPATVFALIMFAGMAGCDSKPEVSYVEAVGGVVVSKSSQSCSVAGICLTCMPGFDMKINCGLKFSPF